MTDTATAPAAAPAAPQTPANGDPAQSPAAATASAPAPAPASAPAPAEPAPLPVEATEGDKGTITYTPTGDKGLDMALAYFGKHGYGPDHPAMAAAIDGDFSLLAAEAAEKGLKGSDAYIALGEKAYEKFKGEWDQRRAADKKAIHDVVGGEENWNTVSAWAKENAEPAELESINKMLGQGGFEARIAASYMANAYNAATGGIPETEGAGPAATASKGAAAATTTALSPQEYGAAVAKARGEHNARQGAFEDSKVYADLRARRQRWRG